MNLFGLTWDKKKGGGCQGDHGMCGANYRCCIPALAGFVSPQSMGPDGPIKALLSGGYKLYSRNSSQPNRSGRWNEPCRVGFQAMNPFLDVSMR